MKVFNFGSVNIDHVYRVPHLVEPGETLSSQSLLTVLGGKGANQSVALARAGVDVQHIGRLGESDDWAAQQLQAAGVDISTIQTMPGPSGHAIIQVDEAGENSIILHGGANQSFQEGDLVALLDQANQGDWLLMQNECNCLAEAFEIAMQSNLKIAFNPAPMTGMVTELPLQQCDVLIVNETEAMALAQTADINAALSVLAAQYSQTRLVLTLGAQGAVMHFKSEQLRQAAVNVTVVDTTGAGDTFVGYFLAALISGLDEPVALHRACAAAALSVTKPGATPSIPTATQVDEFLA